MLQVTGSHGLIFRRKASKRFVNQFMFALRKHKHKQNTRVGIKENFFTNHLIPLNLNFSNIR